MEKTLEDIGIYTDIHESGNIVSDRHKMYYATCKVCGTVVEKRLADIKESNKVCRHQVLDKTSIGGILIILKKPVKYLKKMHQNQLIYEYKNERNNRFSIFKRSMQRFKTKF